MKKITIIAVVLVALLMFSSISAAVDTQANVSDGEATEVTLMEMSPAEPEELQAVTGTEAAALPFPGQLTAQAESGSVVVEGVSWGCETYDAAMPGRYTFTAVLPAGYALAEGVALPQMSVLLTEPDVVEQEAGVAVQQSGGFVPMAAGGNMATNAPGSYSPADKFSKYNFDMTGFNPTTSALNIKYTVHLDSAATRQTLDDAIAAGVDDQSVHGTKAVYDAYLNGLGTDVRLPKIRFTCKFDATQVDISGVTASGNLMDTEAPPAKIGEYSWTQSGNVITFTGAFDNCVYSRSTVQLENSFTLAAAGVHVAGTTASIGSIASDGSVSFNFEGPPIEVTDPATNYDIVKSAPAVANSPEIEYVVEIDAANTGKLDGKFFKDVLDADLVIESAEVFLNGAVSGMPVPPSAYQDAQNNPTNIINYKFVENAFGDGTDTTSAKFVLKTRLKDELGESYMKNGIKKTYKNTAQLNRDEAGAKNVKKSSEVSTAINAKFFSKDGAARPTNSRYYDWTISLSSSGGRVVEAYIIDEINIADHTYDLTSDVKIYNKDTAAYETPMPITGLNFGGTPPTYDDIKNSSLKTPDAFMAILQSLGATQAGYYAYKSNASLPAEDKMVLIIPATGLIGKNVDITYSTVVTKDYDHPQKPASLTNIAKLVYREMYYGNGPLPDNFDFNIGKNVSTEYRWVTKKGAGYDPATQILSWEFTINQFQTALSEVVIVDTLDNTKQEFLLYTSHAPIALTSLGSVGSRTVINYDASDPGGANDYYCFSTGGNDITLKIHLGSIAAGEHYKATIDTKLVDGAVLGKNASNVSVKNTAKVQAAPQGTLINQDDATGENKVTSPLIQKDNKIGGSATTYNYEKKTVGWTVTVNPNNVPIKDAVMTDALPPGTTLQDLIKITRKDNTGAVVETIVPQGGDSSIITSAPTGGVTKQDVTMQDSAHLAFEITQENTANIDGKPYLSNEMEIVFEDFGVPNTTSDTFVLEFTTKFSDENYRHDFFSAQATTITNEAKIEGTVYGTPIAANTKATANSNRTLPHIAKSGTFFKVNTGNVGTYGADRLNASGVSWKIVVNRHNTDMGGFTVADSLRDIFEMDKDTFKVSAVDMTASGGTTTGTDITNTIKAQTGTSVAFGGFEFTIPDAYKDKTLVVEFNAYVCDTAAASDMKNGAEVSDGAGWEQGTGDVQASGAQSFNLDDYCMACSSPYLSISKATCNMDGQNPLFALAGAEFTLVEANADGSVNSDTEKIRVTAQNGKATFMFLKKDSLYRIEETAAPAGYVAPTGTYTYVYFKDQTPYTGGLPNVEEVGFNSTVRGHMLELQNDPKGKVEFKKTTEDGIGLAGVEFTLSLTGTQHQKTAVSSGNGIVSFTKVDAGTYTLKEEGSATLAYELPAAEWTVVVTKDAAGNYSYTITGGDAGLLSGSAAAGYTIKNFYKTGDVQLLKVDAKTDDPLSGAEFTVYDKASGNAVAYLIEDAATEGKYVLSAVDSNGENKLYGKNARGAACLINGKLIYGDYYFSETKTPENYFPDYGSDHKNTVLLKHSFSINSTGTTTLTDGQGTTTFSNQYAPYKIEGVAHDVAGMGLKGARIGIFPHGTTEFTEENLYYGAFMTSGEDGTFSYQGLPAGQYIIAHIEAPAGYRLSSEGSKNAEFTEAHDPAVAFSVKFAHDKIAQEDGGGQELSPNDGDPKAAARNSSSPKTGDDSRLLLFVLLAVVAAGSIGAAFVWRARRQKG
ncbi:hypothetical protein LJC56_02925 [Christensenellaceae bacterium OttesenSCG-928-K19]|nr:hypothetical protein [Christensenellaceae bacterium OttesenSCG-928-K19]